MQVFCRSLSFRRKKPSRDERLPTLNLQAQTQVRQDIQTATLINSIIGIFLAGLSTRIFMISLPTLAKGLGTDILGISWALIAYQVAAIGLGVVCGRLGDIYGHHKIYGFGIVMMAVGSLLCGLSQDVLQLILFRFLQGMGAAIVQSCGRTLGFKAMPEGSEGKAQGLSWPCRTSSGFWSALPLEV